MATFNEFTNNKKKKKGQSFADFTEDYLETYSEENIAPVKTTKKSEDRKGLFKAGRFADGYDVGDVSLTMLNSSADLMLGFYEGVGSMGEGLTDLLLYGVGGVSDLVGADNFADKTKNLAKKNSVNNFFTNIKEESGIRDNSIWGDFGIGVAQGLGQVATVIATGGIAGAAGAGAAATSAITTGVMGASSMGSGISEAYQDGATDGEAWTYGTIKGAVDAGTELIFGGLGKGFKALGVSKGLTSIDDVFARKLSSKMSSQFFKNATEYGVKATAEGVEELLAGFGSAAAKKLTYMSDEELGQLIEDENLLEQFATGVIVSGLAQGGDFVSSTKSGRDYITNLSANEEKVAQAEFESRVAAEEQSGKKLTKKQKNDIYDEVVEDLKKGGISTNTIESVLGGDTYKSYKDTIDSEDAILKEFEELGKKQNATLAEQSRYAELKEKVAEIKNKSNRSQIKSQLSNEVFNLVKENDGYLTESYNENARRGQYFEVDLNKYDGKAKEFMQKLMDSKLANNTRRSHEYFDLAAKMVGDQDMNIDVVDNKKMLELIKKKKGDKFDASVYKGKIVNGLEIDGGIAINVQSAKTLNLLVGHEITHSFEKSKAYENLKNAALQYARTKGVYESLFEEQKTMYEGVYADDGTFTEKVNREVVSEIVGDYLFTDPEFISHLSTKHRNVFLKVFDEIKYFCKIATKGSKEARQLEKVKRAFEKVYREGVKSNTKTEDAKLSLSEKQQAALEHFGTTSNFEQTGFVLDDGRMLNLSQYGQFGVQHKRIEEVYDDVKGSDAINRFIQEGNVRIKATSPGIEIGTETEVSVSQLNTISRFISSSLRSKGIFYLDITDANGNEVASITYDEDSSTEEVIYDIKEYYKSGKIPEPFRYSLSKADNDYMDAVNRGDTETAQRMVDEAASERGYQKLFYHGTGNGDFTKFKSHGKPMWITENKSYAEIYAKEKSGYTENERIMPLYAKMDNVLDLTSIDTGKLLSEEFYRTPSRSDLDSPSEELHKLADILGEDALDLADMCRGTTYESIWQLINSKKFADMVREKGYDAIKENEFGNITYGVLDATQLKSADAVTYRWKNKVIPLSKRFDTENEDIRYSISTEREPMPKTSVTVDPTKANLQKDIQTVRAVRTDTMLKNGYTTEDVDEVNRFMDNLADFMEKAGVTYKFIGLEDVNNAKLKVTYDKNGNPKKVTMSAMVKNGEYPINFDFTRICKKRESMSMVIKELAKRQTADGRRTIDAVNLDAKALWTINEELRKAGLETACLGCFVESKRYNIQAFADKAVNMWNSIVDEVRQSNGIVGEAESFNFAEGINLDRVDYGAIEKIFADYQTVKGRTSPEARMRALIQNGGELFQRYLKPSDLMTPEGIESIKAMSTKKNDFYGILKGVYGQAAPKEVMGFSPYNSEVALLPKNKNGKKLSEYVASIGGVRMQSFSDFLVANVYDYMQMVADLSARHLPAHAYTKEIAFAKIFGMTGIKINMSVMFDIDANLPGEYAGLQFVADENGDEYYEGVKGRWEYLVGDKNRSDATYEATGERPYVQSIGFDEAVALQNDPRYSKNCGIIGVGMSDRHILKMLGDDRIRYIIPYHSSSLPAVIAEVTNIKMATDYTDFQNTRKITSITDANGNAVDIKALREQCNSWSEVYSLLQENIVLAGWKIETESDSKLAGRGGFDIYKDVEATKNPKQSAENYLQYCAENNYMPVFEQFASHENYYKLLYDFDPYDSVTGEYSPQTEVKNIYSGYNPSEGLTSTETVQKIIDDEMAKQNEINKARNEAMPSVVNNVLEQLGVEHNEVGVSTGDMSQSLSWEGETPKTRHRNDVFGEDIMYEAPIREDIAKNATTTQGTVSKMEQVGESVGETDSTQEDIAPIKTPKERKEAKLTAVQTELNKNRTLREESRSDFEQQIARLQAEYDSKKDKNTKTANNLIRRIERLKRLRDSVDADYSKRISDLETKEARVKEGKPTSRQELHRSRVEAIKSKFAEKGLDLDETLKNAKNLSTFATVDNAPQRVMEKSLGYKEGQILADETVNKVAQNETEGIKWLNSFTDRKNGLLAKISKQYNIKPGSKESAAAQMYAEGFYVDDNNNLIKYGDEELAKDFPNSRVQENIKGLARDERIRKIYDDTLKAINESRTRNAYPEIPRLENYFLHFRAMDDTFSRIGLPFNPNDIKAKDLPTDLNGVTADLKPGQPYFASAMHRKGKRTSFDLLGGLERYLSSAKNQIYHIDDIQTLRALRNYIADTFGQANGLEGLDALSEEEAQERIKQVYNSHLSTFAKFLNEEANIIAGKTALIDRGLEGIIGRRGISFINTVNKQVGANMVGFNVSSSLTNFLAGVQAIAKTNKLSAIKSLAQTTSSKIGSIFGKTDSFVENNPTIIRRKGADRFYRTPYQKAADVGYTLMSAVDNVTTEFIVRAKYDEFIRKGMSEEQAILEADKWTSRLMADRSLGQMPQLYNSKMLGLLTKFQLEVRNQLDSQFYDTIQETKASNEDIKNGFERNAKTAAKVTATFFELAVLQHLFGKAFESVAGYNPAFDIIDVLIKTLGLDDDEDDEDTVLDNVEEGFLTLLEDLPYTSTFTGGRIPISSALPIEELIKGEDEYGNEKSRLDTLGEIAPYYVLPGGYGQVKKTVQGLSMFDEDYPISGSYTDSGNLRFPVEDTLANRVQAGVFGQWASENARDYFDNEYAPLNEKQTKEFIDVDIPIKDYREYREGLSGLDTLEEKAGYINSLDLPIQKKNLLINNIANREEGIDLTDYDDYSSLDEFDFAEKYPNKYDFLKENGVSYLDYALNKETKEAYNWAYQNPEKYTVSKAVANDVVKYRKYVKELDDIKADKDSNGKPISGSRKEKVIDYINNLDADYGERIILFKSVYTTDDTYNYDIIEYLNSRNDISYEETVAILKELGFTVKSDGTVTW